MEEEVHVFVFLPSQEQAVNTMRENVKGIPFPLFKK